MPSPPTPRLQEAVQLFEAAAPSPAFNFGGIGSHMQFGAVAAAFGQQPQQQFGVGGGVDWSSPAPSPPPQFVPTPPLPPSAVFGPGAMQYGQASQLVAAGQRQVMVGAPAGGPGAAYPTMLGQPGAPQPSLPPARPPRQLEDPAAALPDDVFDVPAPQPPPLSHVGGPGHHYPGQGQANGQQRSRGYGGQQRGRQRGQRYPQQQQHQQPQHPHAQMAYGPPGHYPGGFPPQMPGW